MIKSFQNRETELIFKEQKVKGYKPAELKKALRKLRILDSACLLKDLRVPPSNKLRKMKGKWKDYYRINVTDKYRLKFKWKDGHAYDVEFCDDHDDL
jgi:proteic killer suppression protein